MPFSIISSAPVSSLCHSLPMTFDLFRTSPYHPLHHSFPIPTLTSLSQPFPHLSTPPNSLSTTSSLLPLPHHLTLHHFILLPPPHDLTLHHCHFFPLLSPSQFLLHPEKDTWHSYPANPYPLSAISLSTPCPLTIPSAPREGYNGREAVQRRIRGPPRQKHCLLYRLFWEYVRASSNHNTPTSSGLNHHYY